MLTDAHRLRLGHLLSEVASPRPCTTAESAWLSAVLGGLAAADQADLRLLMTDDGPVLLGEGARAGVEVRRDGATTVVVVPGAVHRFRDRDAAVLLLLTSSGASAGV